MLPFAQIIDVKAIVGLNNVQDICDVIISTVPVNSVVPNIVVHPVLTELDRKNILNHRLIAPKQIAIKKNELFQVVKKYVDPSMYDDLLKDLGRYLQGDTIGLYAEAKMELDLCKLLDSSRIQVVAERCMWQTSIRLTGKCLVDCGSIENSYLECIISQLQYYGPYMFLTDKLIGFFSSFVGGIVALIILALMGKAGMAVAIVLPGAVLHFFCGATAGVCGNARGGLKGCIAGAFVHGVVATFLIAGMYPVLSSMGFANTGFSDTDFTIVGIIFGNLTKILSGNMMMALIIILFIIPIAYNVVFGKENQ